MSMCSARDFRRECCRCADARATGKCCYCGERLELEARTEKPKGRVSYWGDTISWSVGTNWITQMSAGSSPTTTWFDESAKLSEDAYNWAKSLTKPKPPVEDFCEDDGSLENVD